MQPLKSVESINEMNWIGYIIDYRLEIARLQSFYRYRWAVSINVNYPKVLASAGFYYTGYSDTVQCFECHILISGWNNNLIPLVEHKRLSPNCRFVRIMPCGNVPIGVNPNLIPPRVPKMKEICALNPSEFDLNTTIEVYFENAEVIKIVKIGDLIGAKHPTLAYYESRLDTYILWPVTVTQKKEDLATAGFIYANDGRRVYCFYCGGDMGISKLKDDPKQDHIKWYPNCKFINRLLEEKLAEKQS